MSAARVLAAGLLATGLAQAPWALAAREGQQVYSDVCAKCHAIGRDGAPRLGDAKAWAPREQRGLPSLTDSAVAGVRKMPPHGGSPDVTDLELRRAITYMVNRSGGRWAEPIDRAHPPKPRTGEEIVRSHCIECHAEGRHGAPQLGDRKAWIGRARDGVDSLVRSAIHGHGAMPARGGLADLTDAEMRDAVSYLVRTSLEEKR